MSGRALIRSPAPGRRDGLLVAVAFLEGDGWGGWELTSWFEEHSISPQWVTRTPRALSEHDSPAIVLDPKAPGFDPVEATERLPALLEIARYRVAEALRGFLPPTSADAFIRDAIAERRVTRRRVGTETLWLACPKATDALSDIVLSLLAADILANRAFHQANLCVCDECGRISFEPALTGRSRCRHHRLGAGSGFVKKPSP